MLKGLRPFPNRVAATADQGEPADAP